VSSLWSVPGLYISDVDSYDRTVPEGSYQIVSDGKGCHKSWLQQLEPGSSEDTVRRLGKYYSELRSCKVYTL
jgi:hypothetical protein